MKLRVPRFKIQDSGLKTRVSRFTLHDAKGAGMIELLIAVAIVATSFFAIAQISITALRAAGDRNDKAQALALAAEGVEAVRTIRDGSWTTGIAPLTFGSTYYAVISSGKWTLTLSDPGVLQNKFTRTVVINNVSRDINDNIVAAGGTDDPKTKKATVTISWGSPAKSVQLVTYVMDILKN